MLKALRAGELGKGMVGKRLADIDEIENRVRRREAPRPTRAVGASIVRWIVRHIGRAGGRTRAGSTGHASCRCSGDDVLVRREAWPLVGLEHLVSEGIRLGHGVVGLHVGS